MVSLLRVSRPLLLLSLRRPFVVLSLSLALALVSGYFASRLKIDTDIINLLPPEYGSVKALNKLKETVGSENYFEVAIKSPSFEANKAAAETLIAKSMALKITGRNIPVFTRVEYKKDTELIRNNALYFATHKELDEVVSFLETEIEDAKQKANPFFFELDDEEEEEGDSDIASFKDSYEALIPKEYPVNGDSTVLVLKFVPSGSKSDLKFLRTLFARYDSLLNEIPATSFHPEMKMVWGGALHRHLLDIDSIIGDVQRSFGSGISSVILLVMLYFLWKKVHAYRKAGKTGKSVLALVLRAPVPVLIIGIPLLISLLWTFGLAWWWLKVLNTMTSVLFVILFGMGIDYGIHFYARFVELRAEGQSLEEALLNTYDLSGGAIVTSAFTTAASLGILMIADFRGFSEFGLISTVGIALALFCMMFILPAIVVVFERWNWIIIDQSEREDQEIKRNMRFPFARTVVYGGFAMMLVVALLSGRLWFEYDFGKLEADHPETHLFRETVAKPEFSSKKRNPAYIIGESDEEVKELVVAVRAKMDADTVSPTILDVEALQERFPSNEAQEAEKLERIAYVRKLLDDPFLKNQKSDELDKLRKAASTTEPLHVDDIPDYLKSKFVTKQGEVGRFIIIYPNVRMADGRNSMAFKEDIGKVETSSGKTFYAASTSIVAAEMLSLMIAESPWMVSGTGIFILVFMLYAFRSVRWTFIALLPLIVGLAATFLTMIIFNIPFNFYNLVVLPAILGIGEDNGVHLAHRYREEGKGSMWHVLSSTGQHITIGSLTTVLGFAGLIFTSHPGLVSIGLLASIGITFTWLSGLIFLPATVQLMEDRDWIRF
jgi:predicted RND superfamily exporter protein